MGVVVGTKNGKSLNCGAGGVGAPGRTVGGKLRDGAPGSGGPTGRGATRKGTVGLISRPRDRGGGPHPAQERRSLWIIKLAVKTDIMYPPPPQRYIFFRPGRV